MNWDKGLNGDYKKMFEQTKPILESLGATDDVYSQRTLYIALCDAYLAGHESGMKRMADELRATFNLGESSSKPWCSEDDYKDKRASDEQLDQSKEPY